MKINRKEHSKFLKNKVTFAGVGAVDIVILSAYSFFVVRILKMLSASVDAIQLIIFTTVPCLYLLLFLKEKYLQPNWFKYKTIKSFNPISKLDVRSGVNHVEKKN